ncbi:hypothetical protein [Actinoplanes palleronii]|nr:hypothetical protein [Actinoplanes palleronii]
MRIGTPQPLAASIVALAETPDDVPGIDLRLEALAQLAADRIGAAEYAAVSTRPSNGCSMVAASNELVDAVDDCPSLPPLDDDGHDSSTMITWPGFREAAAGMGLQVVSVPLFTGSGAAIATLDLYGRDADAMAPLTAGIGAAYDADLAPENDHEESPELDAGSEELIAGFTEALSVRATIQLALDLVGERPDVGARHAYPELRLHAADRGVSLLTAANNVISEKLAGHFKNHE